MSDVGSFGFREQMAFGQSIERDPRVHAKLLAFVPNSAAPVRPATLAEQRRGVDLWVDRSDGGPVSFDIKAASFDPIKRLHMDNVCIEIASRVVEDPTRPGVMVVEKLGWTVDPTKCTDYTVYVWLLDDGGLRIWIADARILRRTAERMQVPWKHYFKEIKNSGYSTWCLYPPRWWVEDEMLRTEELGL